jgi:hypothetical protein
MKEAERKAKQIPEDKRLEEIQKNLKQATENVKEYSKQQDIAIKDAGITITNIVENAPKQHKQKLATLLVKSNKLLAQLKAGADVNDIVKKLKELKRK